MRRLYILFFLVFPATSQALKCMNCYASGSFEECDINGHIEECQANQKSCETVVRRYRDYLWITKGCKDTNACRNNQQQNIRRGGKSTQCNSDQTNSFCSCCCGDTHLCNTGSPTCVQYYQPLKQGKDCPLTTTKFPHGNMECYNDGKVCEYKCTEKDYGIWPPGRYTNVCRGNGTWAHETPCCALPCPPYYLYDDVKLLHFERDKAEKRLNDIFNVFVYGEISEDAMKHSVMYFNEEPVQSSIIKFNEYDANATKYMEMVRERVVINNTGRVNTGAAIQYALDHLLTPENGMRYEKVPKTIGILTNANPDDDVKGPAEEARRRGILLYVIGIELDGDFKFDQEKLLQITGHEDGLWIFDYDYGPTFEHHHFDFVDKYYCPNPCDHIHNHE